MACITKRRDRWVIDAYDQHGKRYRKTLPDGTTKGKAREILREVEEKIERRTFAHEKKIPTFSEVAGQWLEHKKSNLRETTWEMYAYLLKCHFKELEKTRIDMVTIATVEKFISTRQKGHMNLSTLRKILVTFNQIMAYAVRHRHIDFNPVRDAEKPRNQGKEVVTETIKVLNPEQIKAFLEEVTNQKYHTLFLTAIMTGARQGELLGLKWEDVDFSRKQIHIQRTFNHGRFFAPKTKGSNRKIDLAPVVIKALAQWKLSDGKNDLIFPSDAGTPMDCMNMVHNQFHPALNRAGCPRIRFHDLRHTTASLLLDQGENIKYISSQLGHANPTTTLNIYAHLMKTENQAAVCRLENTIFEGTGHNLVTNEKKELTVNG
ncbi:MAG: putative prophage phiRv2 integrase [Syntrophus sp. PtaU1.Bin005]|nr:MAG: putative prophage phiRv2 integrase [Syntrophus sp. PtaU1.Bin005]